MQRINNIEIKNFKSIRHQKIDGCNRINVFIGYPNVGKSNVLEALSLTASEFRSSGKQLSLRDLCRYEEMIGLFNDGNKEKKIEIIADDFIYELSFLGNDNVIMDITEVKFMYENDNKRSKQSKRLSINSNGMFGQVSIHSNRLQPEIRVKKYQYKEVNRNLRSNPLVLDFPFGDNLFEVLRYNSDLRKACGELFNAYDLKLSFDENVNVKIQKQLDEFSVFQIPMSQVSDTLQRLVFHKAAIATNQKSILLFEEPEAHMFPPYIKKLTTDILMDDGDNQFFIATHSPYVLGELIEEAEDDLAVYVVDYDKGETIIKRLTDEQLLEVAQYGIDLFFNLESYLDKNG
jgi:AAA15 family ATPase/GTPase